MYKCFICIESLDNSNFLPIKDEYFHENMSIFKNTFIM